MLLSWKATRAPPPLGASNRRAPSTTSFAERARFATIGKFSGANWGSLWKTDGLDVTVIIVTIRADDSKIRVRIVLEVMRMSSIALRESVPSKSLLPLGLSRSSTTAPRVEAQNTRLTRPWLHSLQVWLGPAHCEDCGSPRGPDCRFLCEIEQEWPPMEVERKE
jgi:hypothetical protein